MRYFGFFFALVVPSVDAFRPTSCHRCPKGSVLQNSFHEFLDNDIVESLQDKLSVVEPNEVQDQALKTFFATEQNATIVCAQTGSGKTLTFLLPIIQTLRSNTNAKALVVAPTNLLVEQHQAVAAALSGSSSNTILDRLQFRSLSSQFLNDGGEEDDFDVIALDEIDAVLYGESKMDEETELTSMGQYVIEKIAPKSRVLGTSAFLSRAHQTALLEHHLPDVEVLREEGVTSTQTQVLVPTLRQKFKYFSGNRLEKLVDVVNDAQHDDWLSQGSTMIFCGTVEQAQEVFDTLVVEADLNDDNADDTNTFALVHEQLDRSEIHSLMTKLRRDANQPAQSTTILICTDVAARGLDIPNIRHVILHTVPTTNSAFIHQVGRTARKGQVGLLTCLVNTASGDAQKYTHLHALKAASELSFQS